MFRVLGFQDLGFRVLGFQDLGFRVLGFRISQPMYDLHLAPNYKPIKGLPGLIYHWALSTGIPGLYTTEPPSTWGP